MKSAEKTLAAVSLKCSGRPGIVPKTALCSVAGLCLILATPAAGQTCFSNYECGGSAYCARDPGVCYAGLGECKPRPMICFDLWEPVCGCDGQVYNNSCYAARVGQNVDLSDGDNDGVDDCWDSCPNTIPSVLVNSSGCPRFPVPNDYDNDGDVDGIDFDALQSCASGPAVPYAAGCENKDRDGDGDVDQTDFAFFQRCISGMNIPGDPNCAG